MPVCTVPEAHADGHAKGSLDRLQFQAEETRNREGLCVLRSKGRDLALSQKDGD